MNLEIISSVSIGVVLAIYLVRALDWVLNVAVWIMSRSREGVSR